MSLLFKTAIGTGRYIGSMLLSKIILLSASALLAPSLHAQGKPDVAAQKTAMDKMRFLVGTWAGEATVSLGPDKQMTLRQTEEVQYKLDGILMLIEGTGRDESGKVVFNALATVSFDQGSGTYRIRAWNAGNFIETEIKIAGNGFEWGFQQGPVTFANRMKLDEQGRWSESSEVTLSDGRKLHGVQMLLSRKQ